MRERERERKKEIKEEGNASRIPLVTVGSVGVREKERKKDSDEKACDSYRYTCNWKEEIVPFFSPFFLSLFRVSKSLILFLSNAKE